jgi:flavin-binding protein dodecin
MSVSKIITLVGESPDNWADATTNLIKEAKDNLRGITRIKVTEFDVKVADDGGVTFRVKAEVSFRVESK